jgi:hypothetical protein
VTILIWFSVNPQPSSASASSCANRTSTCTMLSRATHHVKLTNEKVRHMQHDEVLGREVVDVARHARSQLEATTATRGPQ